MANRVSKKLFWLSFCLMVVNATVSSASSIQRFEFAPPPGWVKERSIYGDEESYVWRDSKGGVIARIMVQFLERDREIIRNPASASKVENFNKLFLSIRPKSLEPLGFSQWQIDRSQVKSFNDNKHFLYEVQGTYREPGQRQIVFIERNHFIGRNYYQITWSQEKSKFSDHYASIAKDVLERFKPL